MPEWLRNQLRKAFQNRDARAIRMLNQAFFRYRGTQAERRQTSR